MRCANVSIGKRCDGETGIVIDSSADGGHPVPLCRDCFMARAFPGRRARHATQDEVDLVEVWETLRS